MVPAQVPETVTGRFKAAEKGARSARKKQQSKKPKPRRLAWPITSLLRSRLLPAPLLPYLPSRLGEGPARSHPALPHPAPLPGPGSHLQRLTTRGCCNKRAPHPRKGKLKLEMGGRSYPDKRSCSPMSVRPEDASKVSSRKRCKEKKCRSIHQLPNPFFARVRPDC